MADRYRPHPMNIIFRCPIPAALAGCGLFCAVLQAADPADAMRAEWRDQHAVLTTQLADRSWCARVAGQTEHPAALLEAGDRDPLDVVLRRGAVLLAHLQGRPGGPALAAEAAALADLRDQAAAVDPGDADARYRLYEEACALRRRIAFANPLLDFDRLLFLTRHRTARGDHHMVDQYYGFNQKPGGAVMVLDDPFGEKPVARDLLAGRTVAGGRLDGRPLAGGSFTTLDLDFDGGEILFAWSECGSVPDGADWSGQPWSEERARSNRKPWYYWAPETTYHVFSAPLGGGPLRQLTDGPFNEFDPCYLPDGRVLFISERRGGYLRCGGNRPNPVFTLHSMRRDGGDLIPLSYHETQEWNPSVDNAGMVVYTRWDYVDRDNDMAHHLWVCYPDGRDPRSYHSNYPALREGRPWMELAARSIPGSHRYAAVAAPHHGYHFGSLVLIDQTREDDNLMGQTRRLTPEVHFPESESAPGQPHAAGKHQPNGEVFGTPWPLDEWFHLCVYDPAMRRHAIYLVDAFGNKELIHRDPGLSCLDPIPLRARPRPPVIPRATLQAGEDRPGAAPETGTVAIMNVYESDFEWPAGVRIDALRVIQLFPKSTWHMNEPMVGRGAESLARGVLGEVPVAADGSAYFEVPAGVPVYFQAVDAEGLAVQSMRSATYVHPGERLACVGCHESKRSSPAPAAAVPLAWQMPPALLAPAPDGAMPLSFPRLVQPVLDRHCVPCHDKESANKAPDLSGKPGPRHGWSAAFESLLPHAWALSGGNGIFAREGGRSQAGKLGARAAPLLGHLGPDHHGVELSPEDRRRITLWLDANSNFYGAYHDLEAQAAGEMVEPELR
jgi:hypothetical protein